MENNQMMSEKQYELINKLGGIFDSIIQEGDDFVEMVDYSDILGHKVEEAFSEMEQRLEILKFIKRYNVGEINDTATITISNTMGVMIVEAESDWVFGYFIEGEQKHFFFSEIEYKEVEGYDDSVPVFNIENLELNLAEAIRI